MSDPIVQKFQDRAQKKAAKAGVATDGAVFVAHGLADGHERTLVVTSDRVTVHDHGKAGTWSKKGRGVQEIAVARITSLEVRKTGMMTYGLFLHASGTDLEYFDVREMCEAGRTIVAGLMEQASAPATSAPAPADPLDQLKKLGDLHAAGVLTDEEFAAKKAELLGRM